jgi:hypothetical protein
MTRSPGQVALKLLWHSENDGKPDMPNADRWRAIEDVRALIAERDSLRSAAAEMAEALADVRRIATESGNSITDNAPFWSVLQIKNHAQQTNCEIADRIDGTLSRWSALTGGAK